MSMTFQLKKVRKHHSAGQAKGDDNSLSYTNLISRYTMKKTLLVLGLLLTTTVLADELPKPDLELIAELKEFCTELAEDNGIAQSELKAYILECVNEELESEDYQLLTELK